MAYPSQGERVTKAYRVPLELVDWLEQQSRPRGLDAVCPAGQTANDLVVRALYVLRELVSGIPSPHSMAVLDDALADLDARAAAAAPR